MAAKREKVHLCVQIPVDGEWPGVTIMDARNAIMDEIDKKKIGSFVGAGGGLGAVDFSYMVSDELAARKQIAAIIKRHLPEASFTMTRID